MSGSEDQERGASEIDAARADPHGHLGPLLERYRGDLKALARRQSPRVCDLYGSSVMVQETFTQAVDHFQEFQGVSEDALWAWLSVLLRNTMRQLLRKESRQCRDHRREVRIDSDRPGRLLQMTDPSQPPADEDASLREEFERIRDALHRLPEDWAEVIQLHTIDGLTFAEIGFRLDETTESARHQYRRGIEAMRKMLGYGGGVRPNERDILNADQVEAAIVSSTFNRARCAR